MGEGESDQSGRKNVFSSQRDKDRRKRIESRRVSDTERNFLEVRKEIEREEERMHEKGRERGREGKRLLDNLINLEQRKLPENEMIVSERFLSSSSGRKIFFLPILIQGYFTHVSLITLVFANHPNCDPFLTYTKFYIQSCMKVLLL